MKLRSAHLHDLLHIQLRATATLATVLLFLGSSAPLLWEAFDYQDACWYAGISSLVIITGCYRSCYVNLLTPSLTKPERQLGFVLAWSVGSVGAWLFWQLPYILLLQDALETITVDMAPAIHWKISWHCYALFDEWYAPPLNPLTSALELAYGSIVMPLMSFGIYKYYRYCQTDTVKNQKESQRIFISSLILLTIAGALQSYAAIMYLAIKFTAGGTNEPFHHGGNDKDMWIGVGFPFVWFVYGGMSACFAGNQIKHAMLLTTSSTTAHHQRFYHKSQSA